MIRARMRATDEWRDITICNVSSRGLMAKCAPPPAKGTYIEIGRGGVCVIGRVMWAQGARFGVRAQDRIDIPGLIADTAPARPGQDRRTQPRDRPATLRKADIAAKADTSRHFARTLDWAAIAVAALLAGWLVVETASYALQAPMAEARSALSRSQSRGS
jgi:hypothetical protein